MTTPVPYRAVKFESLSYGDLTKDTVARLFVVPVEPALTVQTTPVVLNTSIEDPDVPFVYFQGDHKLMDFMKHTEQHIEDACISHKKEWFSLAKTLDDDILRRGFKTFFGDAGYKVKIAPDVPCFDQHKKPIGREDIPENSTVRMVMELSRICFGRHEYGATWKVTQVQLVPVECLIHDEPVDEDMPPMDDDISSDIDDFI